MKYPDYMDDEKSMGGRVKEFFMETPLASMFLKILELFTVSMGFSFVLTFIIGSVLARIIHYRPSEVTYTTLFISVLGFFILGGIFLNGFRKFCHSLREYLLIMLSAYSVYFLVSYWAQGLKVLPISDSILAKLPVWLYEGWNNQAFENVFLPLRIFAYYQWLPDWASITTVHALYITMIVIIGYKGGYPISIKDFIIRNRINANNKPISPQTAKARARYEKRHRQIIRMNQDKLDDADVDYDSEEYNEYLKNAFNGKDEPVEFPVIDEIEEDNPNYGEEFDEYMKDAFDTDFDEEDPSDIEEFDVYLAEYDEYLKDAFDVETNGIPEEAELFDFDNREDYEEF